MKMEKLKKRLTKTCKICEFSYKLSQGMLFSINTIRGKDMIFICDNCQISIVEAEDEEEE